LLLKLFGGAGTAPGCGGGGPTSVILVVRVGCVGTYLWVALVGVGIAGAPGLGDGYELVEDGAVVVVAVVLLGATLFSPAGAAAVLDPVQSAAAAFMGLSV
jgi:hypothetical protein